MQNLNKTGEFYLVTWTFLLLHIQARISEENFHSLLIFSKALQLFLQLQHHENIKQTINIAHHVIINAF